MMPRPTELFPWAGRGRMLTPCLAQEARMPNPFPGMDPYLEGDLWTSVHTDLCVEIARQLAPKVRPKYGVLSTRRVVLAPAAEGESPPDSRFADLGIVSCQPTILGAGGVVTKAPLILDVALPEPIPHVSVEIRDVKDRRLVTCIEFLAPTNKVGPGREEYAGKRFQILSSEAHLLEIDLLRQGARFATTQPLPDAPYFVFLSRAGRRKEVEVWPIALEAPLPAVQVPLLPGDADVTLDLQLAFQSNYDILGYDDFVDYSQPPPGRLSPAQSAWLDAELRRSGRRT
jgi:hypothetical protein